MPLADHRAVAAELLRLQREVAAAKAQVAKLRHERDEACALVERWRPVLVDLYARLAQLERAVQEDDTWVWPVS